MDQQQIFSSMVNHVDDADVTLLSVWHDNVLIGVAPRGGVSEKQWVKPGEIVKLGARRWVMLSMQRAVEETDAALMIQLVAVE